MSAIDISEIPGHKQRLLASYASRHGVSIAKALLGNSIDGLVQSEAWVAANELMQLPELPELLVATAEASAAKVEADRPKASVDGK